MFLGRSPDNALLLKTCSSQRVQYMRKNIKPYHSTYNEENITRHCRRIWLRANTRWYSKHSKRWMVLTHPHMYTTTLTMWSIRSNTRWSWAQLPRAPLQLRVLVPGSKFLCHIFFASHGLDVRILTLFASDPRWKGCSSRTCLSMKTPIVPSDSVHKEESTTLFFSQSILKHPRRFW